jgi:hypothetical protein
MGKFRVAERTYEKLFLDEIDLPACRTSAEEIHLRELSGMSQRNPLKRRRRLRL